MIPYQYSPLYSQAGSIRLLRLLPSAVNEAEIKIELFEYSLITFQRSSHSYEALSYVWGGLDFSHTICVGGKYLHVTPNLHAALSQLRDSTFPRILWVDAVCINQKDDTEKALQIQSMAKIYASAKQTIVWLGEEGDWSSEIFETIRVCGSGLEIRDQGSTWQGQAIDSLLQREWFQRIWVLQEVAAARHVVVHCGPAEIDGHAFCIGLERLLTVAEAKDRHVRSLAVITLIRKAIFRSPYRANITGPSALGIGPLASLINMYNTHSATQRHDKIYALLGMATDDLSNAGLLPDYSVPWDELLRRFGVFLLGKSVHVKTFPDKDKVSITGQGFIVGHVTDVSTDPNGIDSMKVKINDAYRFYHGWKENSNPWPLPAITNVVCKGDIIYLLEGATSPMIVRYHASLFHVVAITITPPAPVQDLGYYRTFTIQWEWAKLSILPEPLIQCESNKLTWNEKELGSCWSAALINLDLTSSYEAEQVFLHLMGRERNPNTHAKLPKTVSDSTSSAAITETEVVEIIERLNEKVAISLLTSMRQSIHFTPRVLAAIVQRKPDNVLLALLENGTADLPITVTSVQAAAPLVLYSGQGLATLIKVLHRNTADKSSLAVEPILKMAARNQFAQDIFPLLLEGKIDSAELTDDVLTAAVSNHFGCSKSMMKLLLRYHDDTNPVSDNVLIAAFRSKKCHEEALRHLLKLRGLERETPEAFWLAAASNRDIDNYSVGRHGRERFRLLRTHEMSRKTKTKIRMTEKILIAVAKSEYNGRAISTFLVRRPMEFAFVDGIATEHVLLAAAANTVCGDVVMENFLGAEKDDSAICITEAVMAAAAANRTKSERILKELQSVRDRIKKRNQRTLI